MSHTPLVSISCITFNHSAFLEECFDSFLMQKTDFKFEVLVHDDASTDGTKEIIERYAKKYPEVFFPIIQTENQYSKGVRGIMERFNFNRAKGKYIALCEGDDFWIDPYKLQKQVDFLESNSNYSLVLSNVENLYEYIPEEHGYDFWKHQINSNTDFDINTENLFTHAMGALTAGSMFVKERFKSNEKLKKAIGGEVKFWMLLSKHGKIRFMKEAVARYRRQFDSLSHSQQFGNSKVPYLINRIDYFQNLNHYFENKYHEQVKEKLEFLFLDFIQKQQQIKRPILCTLRDGFKLLWKNPPFLMTLFKWLKVKTGLSQGIFKSKGGKLVVDQERGIFRLENTYGKGQFSFDISNGQNSIKVGTYNLYNKQLMYLAIPELQNGKNYTFNVYSSDNKLQKLDSLNFSIQ